VIEKPSEDFGNLANVWVYKFFHLIFTLVDQIKLSQRWEYELTDAVNLFCESERFQLIQMEGKFIDIWYPWQILAANSYFLDTLTESQIEWTVEDNVTIKWNIILKPGAILKSGTYIEWNCIIWENSTIWPNTYIRWNTVIGNNSKAGNAVEIKNSSLWDNTSVAHLSYIWDSIIWNNVNIWGGMITGSLRHDGKNMRCMINEKLVDTGLRKLGVIIWDGVKTWIHTSVYPGRIIDSWWTTLPGEIYK
jgi:bifunctional UDP-N-acetylglucosamine pyrophosphorylase/glucosamine-1-phosphate N-acetyltransferase